MAVNPEATPDEPVAPLACGRDAARLWDRAARGTSLDEHERGCPHCRAAYADARGLDAVVHRMAAQEIEPPDTVLDRVMGALFTELRPQEVLRLPSPHGPAQLSTPAAAAVLRRVVDGMGGLRARSCRITQDGDGQGDGGDALDVRITVAARFGVDLASVTARVRQMVVAAGEQALGLPVRTVDIHVVDLFEDDAREERP
ncbi:Asp23/Gls24 family envelope stress response protein [Pseudonocardia sp. MH-G8]|uniref:Asp23/Gls24 family envelope stress response protein n=1 Tax=Pseudonocardia sp. MH-G8 TaxID=1854588 RepID=UPI001E615552|nr:Asp23/Gls24 family envelope stress response protein [Pseudonocardia sp. MH-G8]